jgi:peptidoglycan hydrolase CwlO-like protein
MLTRLADAGEEAIAKLTDSTGADRMLGAVTSLRDRMDELQKRVRGLDELERRIADLERRLDAEKPKASSSARAATAKTAKPAAAKTASSASKPKPKPKAASSAATKKSAPKGSTGRTGSGSPG